MTSASPITTLFLDIGGVLLTNAWDHNMRRKAAEHFGLDHETMDERHSLVFDTYELGKLSLDEYMDKVIFHEERSFSRDDFRAYMMAQSQPLEEMIAYFRMLKEHHGLKVAAVSNDGREFTEYRIRKFQLGELIEFFVCSCFVHFRKPDPDIYRIALDISQTAPEQVVYIDDRPMLVDVARSLGIRGHLHTDLATTRSTLASWGLDVEAPWPTGTWGC